MSVLGRSSHGLGMFLLPSPLTQSSQKLKKHFTPSFTPLLQLSVPTLCLAIIRRQGTHQLYLTCSTHQKIKAAQINWYLILLIAIFLVLFPFYLIIQIILHMMPSADEAACFLPCSKTPKIVTTASKAIWGSMVCFENCKRKAKQKKYTRLWLFWPQLLLIYQAAEVHFLFQSAAWLTPCLLDSSDWSPFRKVSLDKPPFGVRWVCFTGTATHQCPKAYPSH